MKRKSCSKMNVTAVNEYIHLQNTIRSRQQEISDLQKRKNELKLKYKNTFKTTFDLSKIFSFRYTPATKDQVLYKIFANGIGNVKLPWGIEISLDKFLNSDIIDKLFIDHENDEVYILDKKRKWVYEAHLNPLPYPSSHTVSLFQEFSWSYTREEMDTDDWNIIMKNSRRHFAANLIKRNCRNWLDKPRTKDGKIGIHPKIAMAKIDAERVERSLS